MNIISVRDLKKEYEIAVRDSNLLKFLFQRRKKIIHALAGISYDVKEGEIVGFIGPNGAGKSTAIKIMTGILVPSSGEIRVLGNVPHKMRRANMLHVGVVFGQRSQLWWDLPLRDSFELLKKMYHVPEKEYAQRLELFEEYLGLNKFMDVPVRQLSLGERMKSEIAVSILHNPSLLFLDEPTIGLDVVAKRQVREFIKFLNRHYNTTIILTTHDMKDIEELCSRVILINKGRLILDCPIGELGEQFGRETEINFGFNRPTEMPVDIRGVTGYKCSDDRQNWSLIIDKSVITPEQMISTVAKEFDVKNISIQEKSIDDIVRDIYEMK